VRLIVDDGEGRGVKAAPCQKGQGRPGRTPPGKIIANPPSRIRISADLSVFIYS
jgi:lipoprotein-anchoring transpeptidase ErfK/SrfK